MKAYLLLSGLIFAAVAVAHAVRLLKGWDFQIGPYDIPVAASIAGVALPAALSAWALAMTRKG